ncbi:MAG: hypothetical protein R3F35_05910 [Myxococcota bacterium]
MEQGAESAGDRERAGEGRERTAEGAEGKAERSARPTGGRLKLASVKRHVSSRGPWIGLGIGVLFFLFAIGAVWIERHRMVSRIEALEGELAAVRHDREAVGSALRSEVERVAAIESLVAEIRVVSKSVIAQIETLDRLTSRALVEAGGESTAAVAKDRLAGGSEGGGLASAELGAAEAKHAEAGVEGGGEVEDGGADAGEASAAAGEQARSTTAASRDDTGERGGSRADAASAKSLDAI